MKTFLIVTFFISISSFGQTGRNLSDQITYVDGGQFKGVIFAADYKLPLIDETIKRRFTPTLNEVVELERELKERIKEINKNRSGQGLHYGPVIDKKLARYIRQYVGFINNKGEKVIYVGLHWNRKDYKWKEDFVIAFDGGSYHWTIRYNLDKDEFSHFGVNGIASAPNGSQQNACATTRWVHLKVFLPLDNDDYGGSLLVLIPAADIYTDVNAHFKLTIQP